MATTFEPGRKYHKFEVAGLGAAPYTFLGCTKQVFQAAPDAPVQPGTSCDYCGTGIMLVYRLRSADGREFKVGCDCILKTTDDRALIVAVKTAKQKHEKALRDARTAKADAKAWARIAAAKALLPALEASWKAEPHPQHAQSDFFASQTLWDWAQWMLGHAGQTGQLVVAKAIETAAAR